MTTSTLDTLGRSAAIAALAWFAGTAQGAAQVRTVTGEGPLTRWLDVEGTPTLEQSVRVPGLRPGDTILVRGEFGVTNDVATRNAQPGSKLYKGEHRYNIDLANQLRMGVGSDPTSGRELASARVKVSFRNHHGLGVVFGQAEVVAGDGEVVNLVASARMSDASPPKRAIRRDGGIAPPSGRPVVEVEQGDHKTKLDVVVLPRGWEATWQRSVLVSSYADTRAVSMRKRIGTHVALSLPLGAVRAGEVFDAVAQIGLVSRNQQRNQLCAGQLVLADSPNSTSGRRVSAKHGFNVLPGDQDSLTKIGAFTATADMPQAWLNVVVNSMSDGEPQDRLDVDRARTRLEVTRFSDRSLGPPATPVSAATEAAPPADAGSAQPPQKKGERGKGKKRGSGGKKNTNTRAGGQQSARASATARRDRPDKKRGGASRTGDGSAAPRATPGGDRSLRKPAEGQGKKKKKKEKKKKNR